MAAKVKFRFEQAVFGVKPGTVVRLTEHQADKYQSIGYGRRI